jgi:hypothetical protein
MDKWDWIIYFLLIASWLRSYIRVSETIKALEKEGRNFGSLGLRWLGIFLVPWAIRQAEKDYVKEQNNNA